MFERDDKVFTKKSYLYNYHYINARYNGAVKICKKIGHDWNIASFNSTFNPANGYVVFGGKSYTRSVENIQLVNKKK